MEKTIKIINHVKEFAETGKTKVKMEIIDEVFRALDFFLLPWEPGEFDGETGEQTIYNE